jgi:hypothetical protein
MLQIVSFPFALHVRRYADLASGNRTLRSVPGIQAVMQNLYAGIRLLCERGRSSKTVRTSHRHGALNLQRVTYKASRLEADTDIKTDPPRTRSWTSTALVNDLIAGGLPEV